MAVSAERVEPRAGERLQPLAKDRPARRVADRVELETRVARTHAVEDTGEHDEKLGIGERVVPPEHLGPDLVELPIAAPLWALSAEHRAAVEELRGRLGLREAALDVRAHDAGRRLRAERQARLVTVDERVHLLLDDIGRLAERAGEELRPLDDGEADLPVAVAQEDGPSGLLDRLPPVALLG